MGAAVNAEPDDLINMELVCTHIRLALPGVRCYVEQTGGGCATIYLGPSYDVLDNGAVWVYDDASPLGELRVVLAGPGWFVGPNWTEGRGDAGDFSVGYDVNDPDPAIAGFCVDGWDLDTAFGPDQRVPYSGERVMATRMVRAYREHPRVLAGEVR